MVDIILSIKGLQYKHIHTVYALVCQAMKSEQTEQKQQNIKILFVLDSFSFKVIALILRSCELERLIEFLKIRTSFRFWAKLGSYVNGI